MSVFKQVEIEYLQAHRLCRLATVGPDGMPHVVPTRYRYNVELDVIEVGGGGFGTSKKFRDAIRNPLVALVIDDFVPPPDRGSTGIEIRGRAEALQEGGKEIWPDSDPQFLRVRPVRIVTWGIEGSQYRSIGRDVG